MRQRAHARPLTVCTLIAGVFATVSSASAVTQPGGLTLYGVADAAIEAINHLPANGGSTVRMTSGNQTASQWGIRGTEDLGGGMRAVVNLESGFDIDTGKLNQGGRMFGRQAFVGLQSSLGTLSLGRQPTVVYDLFRPFDAMNGGPRYSATSIEPEFTVRADNMIKYRGRFGGLEAEAFYSFGRDGNGEVPGDARAASNYGAGLTYGVGKTSVGLAYDELRGATPTLSDRATRKLFVGANHDIGPVRLFAGYRWLDDEGIASAATRQHVANLYWLGAQYKVTGALRLRAAAYHEDTRHDNADPWLFIVAANYNLSKRTDAYLLMGYAHNPGNAAQGINGVGTVVAGENQTGVTLGLRHTF